MERRLRVFGLSLSGGADTSSFCAKGVRFVYPTRPLVGHYRSFVASARELASMGVDWVCVECKLDAETRLDVGEVVGAPPELAVGVAQPISRRIYGVYVVVGGGAVRACVRRHRRPRYRILYTVALLLCDC